MFVLEQSKFGKWSIIKKIFETDKKQDLRLFLQSNPRYTKNTRIVTVTQHGPTAVTYNTRSFAQLPRQPVTH